MSPQKFVHLVSVVVLVRWPAVTDYSADDRSPLPPGLEAGGPLLHTAGLGRIRGPVETSSLARGHCVLPALARWRALSGVSLVWARARLPT